MATALQQPGTHALSFEPISPPVPRIRSNEGDYVEQNSLGWMRPTSAADSMGEMWRRYEEDGYLLVKNLIPREDVLHMREQ
jgi:phytanoyl-CoA hydroxylase